MMIETHSSFQEQSKDQGATCRRLNSYCLELKESYESCIRKNLSLEPDSVAKVAFGQILVPFLFDAAFAANKNPHYAALKKKVKAALELNLLEKLSAQSVYCLYFEFSLERAKLSGFLSYKADLETENSLYLDFVERMHGGQLSIILDKYPELERCLLKLTENWLSNLEELLSRLSADKELLENELFSGREAGELENLTLSLSDSHNKGRAVALLEFANGQSVYYKPRDCSADLNYAVLIDWFCRRGARLTAARSLNSSGYGWSEPVAKQECRSLRQLHSFYEASGFLLCLLYALKAVDIHFENVIARDQTPVLIDCETLMYPDKDELMSWIVLPPDFERDSVFSSNFISPKYDDKSPMKKFPDTSALACGAGADSFELPMPILLNSNLDSMYLEKRPSYKQLLEHYSPKMNSQVVYKGQIQNFRDFKDQILSGFSSMYQLFMKHSAELTGSDSPLLAFRRQNIRAIFRPSRVYTCLLQMSSNPDLMQDKAKRRSYLENTLIAMTKDCPDHLLPLIEMETESLAEDLDAPYFSFPAESTNPFAWTKFRSSCFDGVVSRIASFSMDGLKRHLDEIAACCT